MVASVIRTTFTLPADLLARVDQAVRQGRTRSRNSFVVAAIERELAAQGHADVDVEFAGMAEDKEYLAESKQLDAEFAGACADALRSAQVQA